MTRDEFIDEVTTLDEVMSFCYDHNIYDIIDSVYSEDSKDEIYDSRLSDMVRDNSWRDVLSWLENVPSGYDYYVEDGYGDLVPITDDDIEDFIDRALAWGDDNDIWDEEDEDEDEGEDEEACEEDEDELPYPPYGGSPAMISGLFSECAAEYQWIIGDRKAV